MLLHHPIRLARIGTYCWRVNAAVDFGCRWDGDFSGTVHAPLVSVLHPCHHPIPFTTATHATHASPQPTISCVVAGSGCRPQDTHRLDRRRQLGQAWVMTCSLLHTNDTAAQSPHAARCDVSRRAMETLPEVAWPPRRPLDIEAAQLLAWKHRSDQLLDGVRHSHHALCADGVPCSSWTTSQRSRNGVTAMKK